MRLGSRLGCFRVSSRNCARFGMGVSATHAVAPSLSVSYQARRSEDRNRLKVTSVSGASFTIPEVSVGYKTPFLP